MQCCIAVSISSKRAFESEGREVEHRYFALQVDSHAHAVEEVHTRDAVDRAVAGFAERTEVNRGQLEIVQLVTAQLKIGQRDLASAGGGRALPGIDANILGGPR
ncbi:MAG: hypothetical protein HY233_07155 [Acidobacteriales bacterium]|nr:hypothetical protein [Terriglobales bacterium]